VTDHKCGIANFLFAGSIRFSEQKIQGHISDFSRTPFTTNKSLESISVLGLSRHEKFYSEGLSVFAPFSLEFYLTYKVYLALKFKDFPAPTAIFKDFQGLEFLF